MAGETANKKLEIAVVGGGIGGAVLMIVVGVIKSMMKK